MNPIISCSVGNASIIPGIAYSTRKNSSLTRLGLQRSSIKPGSSSRRFLFPSFVVNGVFPQNKRISSFHKKSRTSISATETEVSVEEPSSAAADEVSGEIPSNEVGASEASSPKFDANAVSIKAVSIKAKRIGKSEMPPVKNEDLILGATFKGKVKSIQPFGAFVDFGAFTDGLVHISKLSDSYVKDVASVVSVGQEVKVKVTEVNTETQRISLSMRENDGTGKQRKDAPISADKDAPISADEGAPGRRAKKSRPRRGGRKQGTKFVVGQELVGTVKNLAKRGTFINLPDGEEGFLPLNQEGDDGFGNIMGKSSLEVGQEINVRVFRITRGQATLTLMKAKNVPKENSATKQRVVHVATNASANVAKNNSATKQRVVRVATNAFALAFRENEDISAFLDEREKIKSEVEKSSATSTLEEIKDNVNQGEAVLDIPDVQGEPESTNKLADDVSSVLTRNTEGDISENEDDAGASSSVGSSTTGVVDESSQNIIVSSPTPSTDGATEKETEVVSGSLAPEGDLSGVNPTIEEVIQTDLTTSTIKTDSPLEVADENVTESGIDHTVAEEEKQSQTSNEKEEFTSATLTESDAVEPSTDEIGSVTGSDITSSATAPLETADGTVENDRVPSPEVAPEDNDNDTSLSGQNGGLSPGGSLNKDGIEENDQIPSPESPAAEVVEDFIDNIKEEVQEQTPVAAQVEDEKVAIASEENSSLSNSNGQTGITASDEGLSKGIISPALVKQLREETGAGMMDCKKALSESGGDIIKAQEFLRKKGLASAEKKATRATAEGSIGAYIHDSRIGVLVEVNCETDFVARGEIFKELVDDIAMQVAACPQVVYLVTDDVPEELVNKEKEIEMQKEDLSSKPEQIRLKIVEGRIRKRLEELALLEQPYIKNDKVTVKDMVKQTVSTVGENIKVKRFVRFNLGEGLEKKSQDFAAEVVAQTAAKPVTAPVEEKPAVAEVKETEQKESTVVVSAALVKQLREETGAGMMDCKKALAETGGDLEKAQAYLRKKGLSSADKKSSRLAAEGRIGSYIHDSRIGVLIEVNCETDFVGRSEKFKELVEDLAMQVVACPQVHFVSIEDIPGTIVKKEKELEMQREDLLSKPENIREKIVEGRISKRLGELALLEQPFIKDDSILVKDLVKQSIAAIGENIKVRRFIRFTLGETDEKETTIPE